MSAQMNSGQSFEDDSSTDDSVDNIDETDRNDPENRFTRSISESIGNCAGVAPRRRKVEIKWPPSPKHVSSNSWRNTLRNVRPGNPYMGQKMQLYSRTDLFLAVYPDGTVRGTNDQNDIHTLLEIVSAGKVGDVKIKGILTNLYIAMNKKGLLYGEQSQLEEATIFIESLRGSYNVYLSRKYAHLGWYLGIKKSGKPKRGNKTGHNQKAVKFLPIRERFE